MSSPDVNVSDPRCYRESLDYLFGLQFFGIKLGLDNVRELLSRVGDPQDHLNIIHLAGTNGKGSTAAALAAVFHLAGIPAGLYTSPHLHAYNERIRIDTRPISDAEIISLIEELRPHIDALRATFFEVSTVMALLSFYRRGMRWAILETGMGGRLDATNVVIPKVSVLSSIALDHTTHLGHSLAEVAGEKAGIIKPSVPVVSVEQSPEAQAVLDAKAREMGTSLLREGRDYHWQVAGNKLDFQGLSVQLEQVVPGLQGEHQYKNLALAAAAVDCLSARGLKIDPEHVKQGLERVVWPGRLEWLPDDILIDGAHNLAGACCLANYLQSKGLTSVHLIFGCKVDKQADELLATLLPSVGRVYVTVPPVDQACDPEALVQQADAAGVAARYYPQPESALAAARRDRASGEAIVVAGSLFLIAVIRELVLPEADIPSIVI